MFSILVSELTPGLLKKAEYWKIVGVSDLGGKWADTRPPYALIATGDPDYPIYLSEGSRHYHKSLHCFPVTLSPDGTEVRLECPRMPDEQVIEEWVGAGQSIVRYKGPDSEGLCNWRLVKHWNLGGAMSPTPEHYPRRTCEGVWVWSTRR